MIQVNKISAEQCRSLRHRVLWPHIELEEDCNIDIDKRKDAIHLGAFYENQIISVCSLFEMKTEKIDFASQYRLRAMATDPNFRGMNAGKLVVEKAIEIIRKNGYEVLWCDARKVALGFYEKCGFLVTGEFYPVRNIGPHKLMYFPL